VIYPTPCSIKSSPTQLCPAWHLVSRIGKAISLCCCSWEPLQQKGETTRSKRKVSVRSRYRCIQMSDVKRIFSELNTSNIFSCTAPTVGKAAAIFGLDLWENGIFTPNICIFFDLAWKRSTFCSCKETIVVCLSFTAGRRRRGKRSSHYLLGKNPLLLFWISVNYQWANQLTPQPESFLEQVINKGDCSDNSNWLY